MKQRVDADYSHLLQALLIRQPLPSMTTDDKLSTCCYVNVMYRCCSATWWYSPSLLWCQQHLCLPCYPERQQTSYGFNKKHIFHMDWEWAFSANGLVWLTFSPARPLSPAGPGRVWPGGPCINHKTGKLVQLHSAAQLYHYPISHFLLRLYTLGLLCIHFEYLYETVSVVVL